MMMGGYAAGVLMGARVAYGVERTRFIRQYSRDVTGPDPADRFDAEQRAETTAWAFALGLVWPVTGLAYYAVKGVAFTITVRPPRDPSEAVRRRDQLRLNISRLEKSLDMPFSDPESEPDPEVAVLPAQRAGAGGHPDAQADDRKRMAA